MAGEIRNLASRAEKALSYYVMPLLKKLLNAGYVKATITILGVKFASIKIEIVPEGAEDELENSENK